MKRATKKKALADLRARRNGLSAVSRTDEYEVKEDDVYERLDEQEYEQLVEKRREREDFVVDDGTYYIAYYSMYASIQKQQHDSPNLFHN